jgi:hypothetical protein
MKTFLTVLFAVTLLTLAMNAPVEAKDWGIAAGAFDGDFGFQLRKDFWLGGDISQITGQGSVYFQNRTTYRFDADYHFILNSGNSGRFYPLAGVDFAVNSDSAKLGLNGGGGFNFNLTEKNAAFVEAKFVFWGHDGFAINGGFFLLGWAGNGWGFRIT